MREINYIIDSENLTTDEKVLAIQKIVINVLRNSLEIIHSVNVNDENKIVEFVKNCLD